MASPCALSAGWGGGSSSCHTVAKNGTTNPDERGSFLDGDLEVVAHPHREIGQHRFGHASLDESLPHPSECPEIRTRFLGIIDSRREQHQARDADVGGHIGSLEDILQFFLGGAVLGGFEREIGLDEPDDASIRGAATLLDLRDQIRGINRVDEVEARGGLSSLVRLEMSDEVPVDSRGNRRIQLRERILFFERFLDAVLAKIELTGPSGREDMVGGEGLRDGDEPDAGWIPAGPGRRPRDSIANGSEPSAKRLGFDRCDRDPATS